MWLLVIVILVYIVLVVVILIVLALSFTIALVLVLHVMLLLVLVILVCGRGHVLCNYCVAFVSACLGQRFLFDWLLGLTCYIVLCFDLLGGVYVRFLVPEAPVREPHHVEVLADFVLLVPQVGGFVAIADGVPVFRHPPLLIRLDKPWLIENPDRNVSSVASSMLLPPIELNINSKRVANRKNLAKPVAQHRRLHAVFLISVLFPLGWDRYLEVTIRFGMCGTSFLLNAVELGLNSAEFASLGVPECQLPKHFEFEALHGQLIRTIVALDVDLKSLAREKLILKQRDASCRLLLTQAEEATAMVLHFFLVVAEVVRF